MTKHLNLKSFFLIIILFIFILQKNIKKVLNSGELPRPEGRGFSARLGKKGDIISTFLKLNYKNLSYKVSYNSLNLLLQALQT